MNHMTYRALPVIAPTCHMVAAFLRRSSDHSLVPSVIPAGWNFPAFNDWAIKQLWGPPFLGTSGEEIFPNNDPLHINREHRGQGKQSILFCFVVFSKPRWTPWVPFPVYRAGSRSCRFRGSRRVKACEFMVKERVWDASEMRG